MATITLHNEPDCSYVCVPLSFLNDHMPQANGEFVKVYLCVLQAFSQTDTDLSTEALADRLACTEGDIIRALHYWRSHGLLYIEEKNGQILSLGLKKSTEEQPLAEAASTADTTATARQTDSQPRSFDAQTPQPEAATAPPKPDSLSRDKLAQLRSDEEFAQLLYIVESYIGKPLTPTEITSLDYYYETLHFPAELIEYLVEYCVSKGHKSFRYIESVALGWHSDGIRTIEQAKQQSSQYTQQYYSVLKAFGVSGRSPIEQEIQAIDRWMKDYGFDTELICEACSRTIQQINKVSFAYADRILSRWKDAGVHTRKDIEAVDAEHESRRQAQKEARKTEKPKAAPNRAAQSRFNNFDQRSYDYQKLEQQLLGAGKKE